MNTISKELLDVIVFHARIVDDFSPDGQSGKFFAIETPNPFKTISFILNTLSFERPELEREFRTLLSCMEFGKGTSGFSVHAEFLFSRIHNATITIDHAEKMGPRYPFAPMP